MPKKTQTPKKAQHALGALPASRWHRPNLRYFAPVDGDASAAPAAPAAPAPVPTPPATPAAPAAPGATPEEPLGAKGLSALQAERDARKAAEQKVADAEAKVRKYEDRDKSEEQRAADELTTAQKELADTKRALIAATKGVPVELLTGTTQAEIEASADALLQFKGVAPKAPEPQRYVIPDEAGKPALGKTESTRPGIGTLRAAYAENEGK